MAELKFSNADISKIVAAVSKGAKWETTETSNDDKFSITLRNDPKKSKIDVLADGKYVDDYTYDVEEKDDVYATVLNVLDYLMNLMNKYNKKHIVKEGKIEAYECSTKKATKIGEAVAEFQEAISKGMLKAYARKMKEEDIHYTCKDCGFDIPKYGGRYPNCCPECNASIQQMKEADKDEAIWGGPFKRGETVSVSLEDPDEFYNATLITYNFADGTYGADIDGKMVQGITTDQIK